MVVLDTNIIIDHLRRPSGEDTVLKKIIRDVPMEHLGISVISVQELYEGKSTRDSIVEQNLLATISPLHILPYTFEVAQMAGVIARDLDRPIETADATIAATAIAHAGSLATLNRKDFVGIRELDLMRLFE